MALVASNSRSGSSGSHDSFVVTNVLWMERVVTKVFDLDIDFKKCSKERWLLRELTCARLDGHPDGWTE